MSRHGLHELVENGSDRKDLFLPDAQQIVVVSGPGDDRAGGVVQVRGFIYHYRGITRSGDNSALGTSKSSTAHRRPTRHAQEPNVMVIEDRLSRLQGGLVDNGN